MFKIKVPIEELPDLNVAQALYIYAVNRQTATVWVTHYNFGEDPYRTVEEVRAIFETIKDE